MIGTDGKPVSREELREHITVYNSHSRGSKEFGSIPRALVTILDNLKPGKTTYAKCADGQVQLMRKKDNSVSAG
jgi:hypothetical protein